MGEGRSTSSGCRQRTPVGIENTRIHNSELEPAAFEKQIGLDKGFRKMGGYSSGRYRTRNRGTVEETLRLDMPMLRRLGFLRPGAIATGPVNWTCRGERSGSIKLAVDLSSLDDAHAILTYAADGDPKVQRVQIVAEPCRFGGYRFYWLCPVMTWRRCTVLA